MDATMANAPTSDTYAFGPGDVANSVEAPEIEEPVYVFRSDSHPSAIDPIKTARKYYRDPFTGVQRELWRPGDRDGDQSTDYYERSGRPLPVEKRWRLFQSDIGPIAMKKHVPPKNVMLDDRAAYEVLNSDIQRAKLTQYWPHDFGGPGKIRARRPHRGRPAIKNPYAEGNAKFQHTTAGGKKETYYFTGEKDYQPVVYLTSGLLAPTEEQLAVQRKKRKLAAEAEKEYNPRGHGHNQYTPKDMMVKHGAPTFSMKEQKKDQLKTPRVMFPEHSVYGDVTGSGQASEQREDDGNIFPDDFAKVHGTDAAGTPVPSRIFAQDRNDSDEEFPIRRPSTKTQKVDSSALPTLDVPRNVGYIERRAYEQKLAAHLKAGVRTQDDVVRITDELSEANIRVGEQAQEIVVLKLEITKGRDAGRWMSKAETFEAKAARFEQLLFESQQNNENLDGLLKEAQVELAELKVRLEDRDGRIEALQAGQWWTPSADE